MGWPTGQSPSDTHPTQVLVAALQAGVAIGQSAFARQPTHTFATVSHFGVAPEQNVSEVQATHDPIFIPLVAHAWPEGLPLQSPS
jgi:hypothetical protein